MNIKADRFDGASKLQSDDGIVSYKVYIYMNIDKCLSIYINRVRPNPYLCIILYIYNIHQYEPLRRPG